MVSAPASAIALVIAIYALLIRSPTPAWDAFALPAVEAACAVILISALALPVWARALSWRPLTWLGRISYSLYLWHFMLLWAFDQQLRLLAGLTAIVIAYASTRWIEEPLRRRARVRGIEAPIPVAA